MTVIIKSTDTAEEVDKAMKALRKSSLEKKTKFFNAWKYFAKADIKGDAVEIQRAMRDE